MKQIDIFGNEIDYERTLIITGKRYGKTIKANFRNSYGFKKGFFCKNCKYFNEYTYNRTYFKCEKIGITHSSATDIRKKDIACNLYKEEK